MNLNIDENECDCSGIYNYPLLCFHQYYEKLMKTNINNDDSLNNYDLSNINQLWNVWNIKDKIYYLSHDFKIEKLNTDNKKKNEENRDILKKFINNLIDLIYHNKRLYFFNNIFNSQITSLKWLYKLNYIFIIIAIIIYIIIYYNICFVEFNSFIYLIIFYTIIFITFIILIIILKLIFSNKFIFENKSDLSEYLSILTSKDILLYYTFNSDIIIQTLILFTILICLKIFPYNFLPFSIIILIYFLNFILFFIYYAFICKKDISNIEFFKFTIIILFILIIAYFLIDNLYEKVVYNNVFKKQDDNDCITDPSNCTIFQNNNANKFLFAIKSIIGIISIIIIIYRFYKLNNIKNYTTIDNIKKTFIDNLKKDVEQLNEIIDNQNSESIDFFKNIREIMKIDQNHTLEDIMIGKDSKEVVVNGKLVVEGVKV